MSIDNEKLVWFGTMEFGTMCIAADKERPIVIVQRIDERSWVNTDKLEDYADGRDYVIVQDHIDADGEIVFSGEYLDLKTRGKTL